MGDDPYVILQVARHAELEVIEAAYRRLARKYHPDVDSSPEANTRMQKINWAYEILKDPVKRAAYDRKAKQRQGYRSTSSQSRYGSPPPRSSSYSSSSSGTGSGRRSTSSSYEHGKSGTSQKKTSRGSATSPSSSTTQRKNPVPWIVGGLIAFVLLWNWLREDNGSLPTLTPTSPRPTSTSIAETDFTEVSDEEAILWLLEMVVEDPRYDPSNSVLHKHLPYLEVELDATSITFVTWSNFDPPEEFVSLGADLILIGATILDPCDMFENRLTQIEVVSPGPENTSATLYVSGRSTINGLASGDLDIFDVMEADVDWGDVAPTNEPYTTEGCPEGCDYQKPGCNIKGNISIDSGEKIYHVPGQEFYSQTTIRPEYGERWFCTEEEAIANGWRKSFK